MRGKVRNRATAVTQWPAADQSGQPIRTKVAEIVGETPPDAHAPTHASGGSDPVSVLTLAGYTGNATDVLKGNATWGSVAGTGDVVGPASAVTNRVVAFDGTTGKLVKDSGVLVADVVVTTDPRMTNARTPTAHTHPESDITNLVADLAATEKTANKNAASGYAGLDASSKLTGSQQKYGSAANTAAEGNDARFSDARTPTAHAASHRSGGSDALVFDQTTSATGTQNNFSLNGPNTVLECSGAAPVFTGFTVAGAAPVGGDRAVLVYTGSGTLRVPKEDGGSTAANRITSPSARGQIVGVGGSITLVYESATSRWGVQAVECGVPIPIAFSAGNFTGGGSSTWTVDSGDVIANAYMQKGTELTWFISISTTTLGGTPFSGVNVALPNGFTVANNGVQVGPYGRYLDVATWFYQIFVASNSASTVLTLASVNGANYASGTNTFYVQGEAIFLVD